MKFTIKKKTAIIGSLLVVALIGVVSYFMFFSSSEPSSEEDDGDYINERNMMELPVRDSVQYSFDSTLEEENVTIQKIRYASAGSTIFGLLVSPNQEGQFPGVVLLPGAGVGKESELGLARIIAQQGYVVLTIDQRGVGETGGKTGSLDGDFVIYQQGGVAIPHLRILDALIAMDVLRTLEQVDSTQLVMAGESLGGSVAIMAGAIEPIIDGVIGISTSGLHFLGTQDPEKSKFIKSIDADTYASHISPREFVMIHNVHDRTINYTSAALTYDKGLQPKQLILVNDSSCNHGYCPSMFDALIGSLNAITDR